MNKKLLICYASRISNLFGISYALPISSPLLTFLFFNLNSRFKCLFDKIVVKNVTFKLRHYTLKKILNLIDLIIFAVF